LKSILLLDNHDSFTWNLAELLRNAGVFDFEIVSSADISLSMLIRYHQVIFSPGPGLPGEQPAMFRILYETEQCRERKESSRAILGVCLGMQAIALHFGGKLINLPQVVHGQPRLLKIINQRHPIFRGIPDGSPVGLYHSWAVDPATLPGCLETLAITHDGTIMALAHKTLPICGVQFHPESIMTPSGIKMIGNWLNYCNIEHDA
jgi:anthranilate synthase/aminodeoxychorismate synthase-like glutamine amidotransferase